MTCYRTLLSLPLEQDSLKLKGNTLGGDGDRNRLKKEFPYLKDENQQEFHPYLAQLYLA